MVRKKKHLYYSSICHLTKCSFHFNHTVHYSYCRSAAPHCMYHTYLRTTRGLVQPRHAIDRPTFHPSFICFRFLMRRRSWPSRRTSPTNFVSWRARRSGSSPTGPSTSTVKNAPGIPSWVSAAAKRPVVDSKNRTKTSSRNCSERQDGIGCAIGRRIRNRLLYKNMRLAFGRRLRKLDCDLVLSDNPAWYVLAFTPQVVRGDGVAKILLLATLIVLGGGQIRAVCAKTKMQKKRSGKPALILNFIQYTK